MLDSVDKMLLRVKSIEFYETPSVYHSNTTLYGGGGGELGIENCEKSAIRSNNFGNDCRTNVKCHAVHVPNLIAELSTLKAQRLTLLSFRELMK